MRDKKGFSLIATILIIVVTAIISCVATSVILYNNYKGKGKTSCIGLAKDEKLREFIDVYTSLIDEYYEDVDKDKLLEGAINGMTDYLGDKYTTYMNKQEKEMLESSLNGKYNGIGVLIEGNEIKRVFAGSPADKAGVKEKDKIVKVNKEDVTDLSATEIVNLIRKNDKEVTITFLRDGKEIEAKLDFKTLDIPSINYEVFDNKIGYLYISSFSASLDKQVKEALEKMKDEGIKSLIVDVRDNVGGYLSSASDVSSLFLEKGKVIYSLASNDEKSVYKDQTSDKTEYPIVVLINENSASSAEILAAALKESYGATLVGKKTYGKGKVQQTKKLKDGSMIKYTSAKWYTPNGDCIDEVGISPDYDIDLDITYNENEEIEKIVDTQLSKAKEILGN